MAPTDFLFLTWLRAKSIAQSILYQIWINYLFIDQFWIFWSFWAKIVDITMFQKSLRFFASLSICEQTFFLIFPSGVNVNIENIGLIAVHLQMLLSVLYMYMHSHNFLSFYFNHKHNLLIIYFPSFLFYRDWLALPTHITSLPNMFS